ncbi:MAG: GIY-YIG nuclease family protein [Clostridiales bacterium]|nr:GIY-YIG nuclease family protein [Clostridiales bacterium]
MNLEQLLSTDNISDYVVLWYGADISDIYFDDEGFRESTLELFRMKPRDENTVFLIMSGINKYKCRYRFAVTLVKTDNDNTFKWRRVHISLDEYAGRLILYRKYGFSFYNSIATGKGFVVEEIWGKKESRTVDSFRNYDDIELSFSQLKETIDGHYYDYYSALSVVKGIYMIIDGNTGKLYIGSAYGDEGIWGRWSTYANTYHGGNEELMKLYNESGEEYFYKFKYIILQILPMRLSDKEIIEIEAKYKNRFLTREFGLNNN